MTAHLSLRRMALLIMVIGLFSFPAFAQQGGGVWAKGCEVDGSLSGLFCSLSTEFRFIPKALAIFSYAAGVMLFFIALLAVKQYGDDPSQTPLRGIVIKFVLGAFLISLPMAMEVVVKTVTGDSMDTSSTVVRVQRPCLAHGSALDSGKFTNPACR